MSLNKFVHGPFKKNGQGVLQFLSSTVSIPTGFYSQGLWRLIFLALVPRVGGPVVGLCSFAPEISLPIFIPREWV